MKLKDGRITILVGNKEVKIEIMDLDASICFVKVVMTSEQFTTALSRLANTQCDVEVKDLDKVGKKMIHKQFEFELSFASSGYHERKYLANSVVLKKCPKGWIPDLSFSSQGSFFTQVGKEFARTTIRKWVKK